MAKKKTAYQDQCDRMKARLARAVPWIGDKDYMVTPYHDNIWKAKIYFYKAPQAARFTKEATNLGHKVTPQYGFKTRRGTTMFNKTYTTVIVTLDSSKPRPVPPPPKPKPFDPTTVEVEMKGDEMTKKAFLAEAVKFPAGEKVVRWMNGEDVEDAVRGTQGLELTVKPKAITMRLPFKTVTLERLDTVYHLRCGNLTEDTKDLRTALWKFLTTAWHYGIRGVI